MNHSIPDDLTAELIAVGAWQNQYVYFDKVWHTHDCLEKTASLLASFIENLGDYVPGLDLPDASRLVIMSPDAVRSNFGIIPVSVLVSSKLKCRFAVWKELADIRFGTSAIMGTEEEGLVCIALQDVVRRGNTAIRMARAMKERDWTFLAYVAAVLNNPDGDAAVQRNLLTAAEIAGGSPRFLFVTSAEDIQGP